MTIGGFDCEPNVYCAPDDCAPDDCEPVEPVDCEPVEPVDCEPVAPVVGEPVAPVVGEPVDGGPTGCIEPDAAPTACSRYRRQV